MHYIYREIEHRFHFSAACGVREAGKQNGIAIVIKNGHVIPLTGPLTAHIHLRSVCLGGEAVGVNVFLYYDSIRRAWILFPLS